MATVTAQPGLVRTSHSGSVEYLGGVRGPYEDEEVELEERKPVHTVHTSYTTTTTVETVQYQRTRPQLGLEKLENVKTLVLQQDIKSQEGR